MAKPFVLVACNRLVREARLTVVSDIDLVVLGLEPASNEARDLPFVLNLYVDNADAAWERAVAAGCEVKFPLADQFWGERQGQLTDPFGHRWNIAQHTREVPPDELAAAAAELFA